jgi:HEAT repeat protein
MPIDVACACGQWYPVREEYAGRQIECPRCGRLLRVPFGPVGSARPARVRSPRARGEDEEEPEASRGGVLAVALVLVFFVLLGGALLGVSLWLPRLVDDRGADATPPAPKGAPAGPKENEGPAPVGARDKTVKPGGAEKKPDTPPPRPARPAPSSGPWKGHSAGVVAVAFTSDGRHALTAAGGLEPGGGQVTLAADNTVRRWDARTGKEVERVEGFPTGIAAAAFSPDGRYAAVGGVGRLVDGAWVRGADHDIHLWDLKRKRELRALKGHTTEVLCLGFSPNGGKLLSGGADGVIRLWDVGGGKLLRELKGHTGPVNQVVFAPGGTRALSAGSDHTARLWDVEAGKELSPVGEHPDAVRAVAISPDGRRAATAGAADGEVRVWDLEGGELVQRLRGHRAAVAALAFSPEGRRLLSAGQTSVRLWQLDGGREVARLEGHAAPVRAVAFFPDRRRALCGGDDGELRVWRLPADLPDLVKDLGSADRGARRAALAELAKLGGEARPALGALLDAARAGEPDARAEVLGVLRKLGPPGKGHVGRLVKLLEDRTFPAGRAYALEALAELGPGSRPARKALVAALGDRDPEVRLRAARALGRVGAGADDLARAPLLGALRDPDRGVREAARDALARAGRPDDSEVPALRKLLKDRYTAARRYAVDALGELGPAAAPAVPDLAERAAEDLVAEVRRKAVEALARVGPQRKEAVGAFRRALGDDDVGVCRRAARALAGGKEGSVAGLLEALGHADEEVRRTAEEALGKVKFEKADVPALAKALGSPRPGVRRRALEALGSLGADAEGAVPALCRLLKGTPAERGQALKVLRGMGRAAWRAGPHLAALLEDKDVDLRLEVSEVLARTGAPEAEQAVPVLVKMLKPETLDEVEGPAQARREKVRRALVRVGKPAVKPLADALAGEFAGGSPRTTVGVLKGVARLEVLRVLSDLGPKANSGGVLVALARLERGDPFPGVRKLAKEVRVKAQKEEKDKED